MASLVKLVALLCVVVAVSTNPIAEDLIETDAKQDQSAILGNCTSHDRLLYQENIDVKGTPAQIKKKNVNYSSKSATITCIKILDQLGIGNNAAFKINKGGVNKRFVVINFQSEEGGVINYVVQLYHL